jgi:hypothetical protein
MVAVQFQGMPKSLDLYLIATRKNRSILFSPLNVVEVFEEESDDRIGRVIEWFKRHRSRLLAWVGRVLEKGHEYYIKLEDRIDPAERVLKAMASVEGFVVYHGLPENSEDARMRYKSVLRRQRLKHRIWFGVDMAVSAVALIFTPILAPIPGPNLFLYFPLLRMLSHYRAMRGAKSGLRSEEIEFKCLPDLIGLEENLRTPPLDRRTILAMAEGLNIRGLEQFLERMV